MSLSKHNVSFPPSVRLAGCQSGELRPEWDDVRRRFWAKVRVLDSDTACWLWVAGRTPRGYGQFMWAARFGRLRPVGAHRVAYELTHGVELADGEHVCHTCDNRPCVNPAHLFLGNHKLNMEDAQRKGRLHVSRPSAQKVTDAQVLEILTAAAQGVKQCDLAQRYGVTTGAISQFISGKRRPWLLGQRKETA